MKLIGDKSFNLWVNHEYAGERTCDVFCTLFSGTRCRGGFEVFSRVFLLDEGPGIPGVKDENDEQNFQLDIAVYAYVPVSVEEQLVVIGAIQSVFENTKHRVYLASEYLEPRWLREN